MYLRTPSNRVAVCSPYMRPLQFVRETATGADDSSWEHFGMHSLPTYFTDGVHALREHLTLLEDATKPYTIADENRFWFMVESLIQARRLIEVDRDTETQ